MNTLKVISAALVFLFSSFFPLENIAQKNNKNDKKKKEKSEKSEKKQVKNSEAQAQTDSKVAEVDDQAVLMAEKNLIEGLKYYQLDNYTNALASFQKAMNLNPRSSGIQYQIAETYLRLGKPATALAYAEKALELDSDNKYNYILLARIQDGLFSYQDEAKVYEKMLSKNFYGVDIYHFQLAMLYQNQLKDYKKALQSYETLEGIYGIKEDFTKHKQQIYIQQNKPELALSEAEKLIKASPNEPRYVLVYAELLLNTKQDDKAIAVLEKIAVGNDPANAQANLALANLYRSKGNTQKANQQLELALNNPLIDNQTKSGLLASYVTNILTPEQEEKAFLIAQKLSQENKEDVETQNIYASMLIQKGDKKQAREVFSQIVKIDNSRFEAWNQLLRLDSELRQADFLIKDSEKALELYPNYPIFWLYSGVGHYEKKDYATALEIYEQGISYIIDNANLKNEFTLRMADVYNALKKYEKSDKAYEEVLAKEPKNAYALNNYSYFLSLRKEKLDLAKNMSANLVELYPENTTYLDTHAWVLYTQGKYKEAKIILEKAIQNSPSGTVVEHYGDVLFKLNETEKAVEEWKKAQKLKGASLFIQKKISEKKIFE
jgi:tetratricopeptide (TPR) repeat protein